MSAALALVLSLVIAQASPTPPATSAPQAPAPAQLVALPVVAGTLDVQSTGEDPKVALRPALRSGDAMTLEFTAEGLMTRFGEGVPRSLDRPLTVLWTLDLRVDRVGEDGRASIAAQVRDVVPQPHPSNPPAQVEKTLAEVAPLKGRTIEIDVAPDGGLTGLRIPADALPGTETPPAAGPEEKAPAVAPPITIQRFSEALGMLFRPAPQVPIGKGARWQVRTDRRVDGADRVEVATTTVDAIDDTAIKTKLVTVVRPQKERASMPEERVPGSRLVVLVQLSGNGGGTVRWDGKRYLPVELHEQTLVRMALEGLAKDSETRRYVEQQDLIGVRIGR